MLAARLNTAPHRIAARDESRRAHAGTIADLFASIMCQVVDIGVDKLDTAMDILRHDFPNVEHIWLAERFQTAYEAAYPCPPPWPLRPQTAPKKSAFLLLWKCTPCCYASAVI